MSGFKRRGDTFGTNDSKSLAGSFAATVKAMIDARISGPEFRAQLAATAQSNALRLIASGQASPRYRRFVNGVEDAPNESVRLDGSGSILYQFSRMGEVVRFALNFAVTHSPRKSGEFADSWFILVNTVPYEGTDFDLIPLGAEVTLTNNTDYARKIDVGGMKMSVAPQIVEQTRQAVMARFPTVTAERVFLTIPGGYVLKGRAFRSGLVYDKKGKKFGRMHAPKRTNRSDARRGEVMTYPSLVMYEGI